MQAMIGEYKRGRELLSGRIHELTRELAENKRLKTKEREKLELRRELLIAERTDMLHAIVSMEEHHRIGEVRA